VTEARQRKVERIAAELHATDIEWFDKLPCKAGRPYPMAFIRNRLTKMRRRFWLFGDRIILLTPLGHRVRAYLRN
jgi:hypothetical protein